MKIRSAVPLTKEDLDSHQIRISELAYGTEKPNVSLS